MIGSGIFALPSQMAGSAAPGPVLIGWVITGVGMLMLAFVFQNLATRKPDVDGGVYGYARARFGNYIGFTSAFGYWVSAWVGNVAYLVLLFSTLGYFFGAFEGGATVLAIIGGSILLWILHAMTLRGVKTAAFVNVLVTNIFRCCWRRFHSSSEFAGPEGPCRGDPESVVGKRYSACTVTLLVQAPPSTWAARCPIATARRAKASAVHDAMRTTH